MDTWRAGKAPADIAVTSNFMVGGNLTLMRIDIADDMNKQVILTGIPDAKGIAYVKWRPMGGLTITPNVEIASDRWTQNTSGTLAYKLGAYTLANISAEYEFRPGTTFNRDRPQPFRHQLHAHRRITRSRGAPSLSA